MVLGGAFSLGERLPGCHLWRALTLAAMCWARRQRTENRLSQCYYHCFRSNIKFPLHLMLYQARMGGEQRRAGLHRQERCQKCVDSLSYDLIVTRNHTLARLEPFGTLRTYRQISGFLLASRVTLRADIACVKRADSRWFAGPRREARRISFVTAIASHHLETMESRAPPPAQAPS